MNREDRHTLTDLIEDLLASQRTYVIKLLDAPQGDVLNAAAKRRAIKQRLIEFVEELEARNESKTS